MRTIRISFWLFFCLLAFATSCSALYDPQSVPNNRFGIHIVDENDLSDAARLVNSAGGDWGYVKLVIREDDRSTEKWQAVFDRMRRQHVIPLVRLATKVEYGTWIKPRVEDIGSWVDFLYSLNWVIKNRYVIIFNEPNHANEWGGQVNPEEYGWYLKEFSRRLKEKSPDFFVLPAGLDASASTNPEALDELAFIKRMHAKEPDVFDTIDGWTSHSYPNPDFSGNPNGSGRGTIRTFTWELEQLHLLGVKSLPVFITETGWRHSGGQPNDPTSLATEKVADNFRVAFQSAWSGPTVVAVTPFLLNYQDGLFGQFSWKKYNSNEFYPMFEAVQSLVKTSGQPKQYMKVEIVNKIFPEKLVTGSEYTLFFELENTGQSLVSSEEGWQLYFEGLPLAFETYISRIMEIAPYQRTRVEVKIKTPAFPSRFPLQIGVKHRDATVTSFNTVLTLVPPPSLLASAKIWIDQLAYGNDYTVLFYDESEKLLHEAISIEFKDGLARVENLYNIVPNHVYRLVLTKPYYLPRHVFTQLSEGKTAVSFPTLLPFDPSNDGVLTTSDIEAFLKRPLQTFGLLIPL